MLLADAEKARLMDYNSINKYNIPSALLMENAGMRVADVALKTGAESFCVVAGKGNNGGDGSVVARHLYCNGKNVALILLCDESDLKGDARLMYETAKNIGVEIGVGFDGKAKEYLKKSDVVIDAIFGIGFSGTPTDFYTEVINYINGLEKHVIAIDVPSGVDATNGNVCGVAVRCTKTVTFNVGRLGLCLYPAKEYAGRVLVENISFVPDAIKDADINVQEVEYKKVKHTEDCHKGSVGKVLLAAGSKGMTGAAYIASQSALRCGSGVVTLCIPRSLNDIMEKKLTEVMTIPVSEKDGAFSENASKKVVEETSKYNCLVIGCGMGNSKNAKDFLNSTVKNAKCPMVIDADGLNCLDVNILKDIKQMVVVTPHLGEMARLTGKSIGYIKDNLCDVAISFAKEYGASVVLKCATTVVAFPNGKIYINTKGNRGMATAGSGDALAGIIGSFVASGIKFEDAVVNGVYLHSASGDIAAEKFGKEYMSATDIVECLKCVL